MANSVEIRVPDIGDYTDCRHRNPRGSRRFGEKDQGLVTWNRTRRRWKFFLRRRRGEGVEGEAGTRCRRAAWWPSWTLRHRGGGASAPAVAPAADPKHPPGTVTPSPAARRPLFLRPRPPGSSKPPISNAPGGVGPAGGVHGRVPRRRPRPGYGDVERYSGWVALCSTWADSVQGLLQPPR